MNRNDEWKTYIDELKSELPPQIHDSPRRAVLRARRRKELFIKLPAFASIGVCMSFILFIALKSASHRFSGAADKIRPFGRLFGLFASNSTLIAGDMKG